MSIAWLDLMIIQGSVQIGYLSNVRFRSYKAKLVNVDQIDIRLRSDAMVGLHLRLPGTAFDVLHRAIMPEGMLPGEMLCISPGSWMLHPNLNVSFQPLEEILRP